MTSPRLYQILDANYNRACEGLRVIEEAFRFYYQDERICVRLKDMRHAIGMAMRQGEIQTPLILSRDVLEDRGRRTYTRSEMERVSVEDVVEANMRRVQEALRVLEEYSKLLNAAYGEAFKKIRFDAYQQHQLLSQLIHKEQQGVKS